MSHGEQSWPWQSVVPSSRRKGARSKLFDEKEEGHVFASSYLASTHRKPQFHDRLEFRSHKVLMSFRYWNAWDVMFFDTDHMRTALPRRARFNSDEALIEFAERAGGIKMSEDRQILDMMIQRKTGEVTLNLTDEQYTKLRR
jgi:hypothetical protein